MAFILNSRPPYEHPPGGPHKAVCAQLIKEGIIPRYQGELKDTVKLVWQLEVRNKKRERFTIAKKYTNSTHPKAAIVAEVHRWLGKSMTRAEWRTFDLDTLIGLNCQLNCITIPTDDGEITIVDSLSPLRVGEDLLVFEDFKPRKIPILHGEGPKAGFPTGEFLEDQVDEGVFP